METITTAKRYLGWRTEKINEVSDRTIFFPVYAHTCKDCGEPATIGYTDGIQGKQWKEWTLAAERHYCSSHRDMARIYFIFGLTMTADRYNELTRWQRFLLWTKWANWRVREWLTN